MPVKRDMTHDDLRRLHRVKTTDAPLAVPLGAEMIDFFKHAVTRRQNKLVKLAECWTTLVPPLLNEHCAGKFLQGHADGAGGQLFASV